MVGVVGNLKISYRVSGERYEQVVDPQTTVEFCLEACGLVKFRVEEVTYVEDTVYGVVLSLIEPRLREDEFVVGRESADFSVEEYGVSGEISLCF